MIASKEQKRNKVAWESNFEAIQDQFLIVSDEKNEQRKLYSSLISSLLVNLFEFASVVMPITMIYMFQNLHEPKLI